MGGYKDIANRRSLVKGIKSLAIPPARLFAFLGHTKKTLSLHSLESLSDSSPNQMVCTSFKWIARM